LEYNNWQLARDGKEQALKVKKAKVHGKGVIALPEGVDTRDQAEALIGSEIWINKDQLEKLQSREYYWHQLEGLKVQNKAGEFLGVVSHMIETGANDVLVVQASDGSIDDQERLIPYVDEEVVMEVDIEAGKILVAWDADY